MAESFSGLERADFNACRPTKRNAHYLHDRLEQLRETFVSEYPEWGEGRFDSYVSRTTRRMGRGRPPKYRKNQWVGFALEDREEARPQDSVQLQASIHREEFDAMVWLDFQAPRSARDSTRRNILSNASALARHVKELGDGYSLLTWDEKDVVDFDENCRLVTKQQLVKAADRILKPGSALYIGRHFTPRKAISRSLGILEDIARTFRDLAPVHLLLSGKPTGPEKAKALEEARDGDSDDDFGKTERIGKGQGFFGGSSEKKKLIEDTAMDRAKSFFRKGWKVKDVSKRRPYDLECSRGREKLFVEVKGTTGRGEQVLLSRREVRFARKNAAKMALFVLHSIDLRKPKKSGTRLLRMPWKIDLRKLEPSGYLLSL
jgi:hypothetical protein